MSWLLLLISVGCVVLATLCASATLFSGCLLLSLPCALAGGRGLYRRHRAGSGDTLIDSHELKRRSEEHTSELQSH